MPNKFEKMGRDKFLNKMKDFYWKENKPMSCEIYTFEGINVVYDYLVNHGETLLLSQVPELFHEYEDSVEAAEYLIEDFCCPKWSDKMTSEEYIEKCRKKALASLRKNFRVVMCKYKENQVIVKNGL